MKNILIERYEDGLNPFNYVFPEADFELDMQRVNRVYIDEFGFELDTCDTDYDW